VGAAIIAAIVSVAVGIFMFAWTSHENKKRFDRERKAKCEDEQADAARSVARVADRLLAASEDLVHRYGNIREKKLLMFYAGTAKHQAAMDTTLYRLAKFFAAKELFDTNVDIGSAETLAPIAGLLKEIGETFTADHLDTLHGTPQFMMWREEQRALGELATRWHDDGNASLVGYAPFIDQLGSRCVGCFDTFRADLKDADWIASERIRKTEKLLRDLVEKLIGEGGCPGVACSRTQHSDIAIQALTCARNERRLSEA
jgi:hypothetical protein